MEEKGNLSVPELLAAAKRKDADAMEKVAFGYYTGLNGFESDGGKAFYWAKEFVAAHPEEAYAWELLGRCCFYGIGTNKSDEDAEKYFSKAASLGRPSALYALAEEYFYSNDGNIRNRPFYLLHEATGYSVAHSAFQIAQAFRYGKDVSEAPEKSIYYYRRAMDLGYAESSSIAYLRDMGELPKNYPRRTSHKSNNALTLFLILSIALFIISILAELTSISDNIF